ncbi:MAG: hypothetical protein FJ098_02790 [Deltaproteobacteria bacterium]|nr:hypothetical protein [Deltaproteobacteria bacterium]
MQPSPGRAARHRILRAAGLLLALGTLAGYSLWARDFLWLRASSLAGELLVPLGWLALILLAAALATALLAELLLSPPRTLRARGAEAGEEPPARGVTAALFQPRAVLVSLLFLVCATAAFAGARALSFVDAAAVAVREPLPLDSLTPSGRLSALTDPRELSLVIRSRATDPRERDAFLRKAAALGHPGLLGLAAPRIVALVEDPDPAAAAAACRALAALGDRMNQNVLLLDARPAGPRWEPELLAWLRGTTGPWLAARRNRPGLAAPILEALAWFQAPADAPLLREVLEDPARGLDERLAAATGLGLLARTEDLELLSSAARGGAGDRDLDLRVLWALTRQGEASRPEEDLAPAAEAALAAAVEALSGRLSDPDPAIRCAALTALRAFQDARCTRAALAFFEADTSSGSCPRVEIPRPHGAALPFVTEEEVRFKILNLLASVALDNRELRTWLERMSSDPRWPAHLRDGMVQIHSGITARD